MPDENGETRRQRNDRVGEISPKFYVPMEGRYLWDWFTFLNESVPRIQKGICYSIAPSEIKAWSELSGNVITPRDYDILVAMDQSYCSETNKEFQNIRSKQEELQKRQVEDAKKKRGRK